MIVKEINTYHNHRDLRFIDKNDTIGRIYIVYDENGYAEIRLLLVYPKYRKLGYGKKILSYGLNECRHCKKIYLCAQPCNEPYMAEKELITFYEKFGFKINEKTIYGTKMAKTSEFFSALNTDVQYRPIVFPPMDAQKRNNNIVMKLTNINPMNERIKFIDCKKKIKLNDNQC